MKFSVANLCEDCSNEVSSINDISLIIFSNFSSVCVCVCIPTTSQFSVKISIKKEKWYKKKIQKFCNVLYVALKVSYALD